MFSRTLCMLAPRLAIASINGSSKLHPPSRLISHPTVSPRIQARMMTTPPPQVNVSDLPVDKYNALSEATMDTLLESLENLLDDLANPDYEVEYHSGVLTLSLGEKGTYVINKQPPNKQIWLSSPFSGPKRYDYSVVDDNWLYSRDGQALGALLNEELTKALDQPVDIGLEGLASQLQR
ncbi:hypothetical protein H0H92_004178 [Tricholoma furcatifolium]|nr:hypothetical protein H0H92_004178 [Tricholoma furcatifolium]